MGLKERWSSYHGNPMDYHPFLVKQDVLVKQKFYYRNEYYTKIETVSGVVSRGGL